MQLLLWFVNSNIQNAFSIGIIGLAYGPVFPASLTLANDILPPDIHMVSMAIMCVIYFFHICLRKLIINCKIDLPTVALDLVRTVAVTFAGSNRSLFYAALFPFVAGFISSIKGIHTLMYITVPLASAIACLWFLFPSRIPHPGRATIV
jgi:fucose permease